MSTTQGVLIAAAAAGGIYLLLSSRDAGSARDIENPEPGDPPVNRLPVYGEPGYENPAIKQPPQTYDPYKDEIPMPEPAPTTSTGVGPGTCLLDGMANPIRGTNTLNWAHQSPDACFTYHQSMFSKDGYSPYKPELKWNDYTKAWEGSGSMTETRLGYQYHDGMYVTPNQGATLVPDRVSASGQQLYTISPTDITKQMGDPITPEQVEAWTSTEDKPCFVDCPGGYAPAAGLLPTGQPNFIQNNLPREKNECKAFAHVHCMGGKYLTLSGHTGIYWGNEQIANASYPPDVWERVVKGEV